MKLFTNRKRQQAIHRIADHAFRDEAVLRSKGEKSFGHSVEDWGKLISAQCTDEVIFRIDAYLQESADYYPRLFVRLQQSSTSTANRQLVHDNLDMMLTWIETLTPILKSVIAKHGDPMESGFVNAMDSASEILDSTMKFLNFMHKEGAVATSEQQKALMSVAFLLLQSESPRAFAPYVAKQGDGAPPSQRSTDAWLTVQALTRPTEAATLASEYPKRIARRKYIADQIDEYYTTVQDHLCDYSDDLIDQIAQHHKSRTKMYSALEMAIDAGASESAVRDILFFAPQLQMGLLASGVYIMNLHTYEDLPTYDCYSQAPTEVRDQCLALLTVSHAIIEHNRDRNHNRTQLRFKNHTIGDDRLVKLLLEHPNRADSIAAAIEERGSVDFDLISVVTTDSLSEGLL